MTLRRTISTRTMVLDEREVARIGLRLDALERRLEHHPEPHITLTFAAHPPPHRIELDVRLQLGPLGGHLISHQTADTAAQATRLAVIDIERQLERRLAAQRGEPSFGVPSRRPVRPRSPAP